MKAVEQSRAMQEGMRRLASGVTVVTASDMAGQPFAMTATSVTSLSDSPASLLVCINKEARMFEAISQGGGFCVNLLSANDQDVSNRCSSGDQGLGRFDVGDWDLSGSLPRLNTALAQFLCTQDKILDYGTHRIVIGVIDEVYVENDIIDPLVYLNGRYHQVR